MGIRRTDPQKLPPPPTTENEKSEDVLLTVTQVKWNSIRTKVQFLSRTIALPSSSFSLYNLFLFSVILFLEAAFAPVAAAASFHAIIRMSSPSLPRSFDRKSSTATTSIAVSTSSTIGSSSSSRRVYGKDDALFGAIESMQGDIPFGRVLDAGTGLHSLRWLVTLRSLHSFVAITADESLRTTCQRELRALEGDCEIDRGEIMAGNWFPHAASTSSKGSGGGGSSSSSRIHNDTIHLEPESFDVILADYLIGAMDGFSPYHQDEILDIIAHYLKPGGRLYVVGLQPIPDSVAAASEDGGCHDASADIICKVRRIRDACILLAGHRCYREYPVSWVERQLTRHDSSTGGIWTHLETRTFPILYRHETIVKQINVGRSKLQYMEPQLAATMAKVLDDLEVESRIATERAVSGRIQLGFDYVVCAQKKMNKNNHKSHA
jgi:hypothetical protein